jgi:hypothetical protein
MRCRTFWTLTPQSPGPILLQALLFLSLYQFLLALASNSKTRFARVPVPPLLSCIICCQDFIRGAWPCCIVPVVAFWTYPYEVSGAYAKSPTMVPTKLTVPSTLVSVDQSLNRKARVESWSRKARVESWNRVRSVKDFSTGMKDATKPLQVDRTAHVVLDIRVVVAHVGLLEGRLNGDPQC